MFRRGIPVAVLLVLTACAGSGSSSSDGELEDIGVQVASQEEFDVQADGAIDASNADAEFDKLMKEIESDG